MSKKTIERTLLSARLRRILLENKVEDFRLLKGYSETEMHQIKAHFKYLDALKKGYGKYQVFFSRLAHTMIVMLLFGAIFSLLGYLFIKDSDLVYYAKNYPFWFKMSLGVVYGIAIANMLISIEFNGLLEPSKKSKKGKVANSRFDPEILEQVMKVVVPAKPSDANVLELSTTEICQLVEEHSGRLLDPRKAGRALSCSGIFNKKIVRAKSIYTLKLKTS